jgi:hypothetical protein
MNLQRPVPGLLLVVLSVCLLAGPALLRPAPAAALPHFEEVGEAAGFTELGRWRGSAWADVDGDGLPDVGMGCQECGFHIYRNNGDFTFTEISDSVGVHVEGSIFGVNFIDVDNDGDLDLFITGGGFQAATPAPDVNRLYLKDDGVAHFTRVPDAGGLSLLGYSFSAAWADVDGDGLVDVFVSRVLGDRATPDGRLFKNLGNATFEDITESAGLGGAGESQQCLFFDADGDLDPDLILANRDFPGAEEAFKANGNQLFLNDGTGDFTDASTSSGMDSDGAGFAAHVADIDRDGDLDVFFGVFNMLRHKVYFPGIRDEIYVNEGGRYFRELGPENGITEFSGCMGGTFVDVDNDGWVDFLVARGGPEPGRTEWDLVYRNLGGYQFVESAHELNILNRAAGHGATTLDLDRDGDLDILVPSGSPPTPAHAMLFRNDGPVGNHVSFVPQDKAGSPIALGAHVRITVRDTVTAGEILGGGSFASQPYPETWFGLNDADRVDAVTVTWRDGTVRTAADLPVNRTYKVLYPRTFFLHGAGIDSMNAATGTRPVHLGWGDGRLPGAGTFSLTVTPVSSRAESTLTFTVSAADTMLDLPPGSYVWGAVLTDAFGTVSASTPALCPLSVPAAPEPPAPASNVWAAYPNPFARTVTFAPPAPGTPARVDIYDVRGRRVAAMSAVESLEWNGVGRDGREVAPGIYYARIHGAGRSQTLKLVRLRKLP